MADFVRVVLLPKDPENAADRQITLDLKIDDSGSAIGPFPAFGRVGDFKKPDTVYPFTLMGDGRLDYGAYASDTAEQDKLAIRSTVVAPGAEIVRATGVRTESFVIATVTSLVTD